MRMLVMLAALAWPVNGGGPQAAVAVPSAPAAGSQGPAAVPSTGERGYATYYAPGLMEQVYRTRLRLGHVEACAECVGYVARPERAEIGRRVWIKARGETFGPFLVVDCAAPRDLATFRAAGRVVEVGYDWAVRWGMVGVGPLDVEIYERLPP